MRRLWFVLSILFVAVIAIVVWFPCAQNKTAPVPTENAVSPPQNPTVEITYIANEGVLISADGKQVLIDGLHREMDPSMRSYHRLSVKRSRRRTPRSTR